MREGIFEDLKKSLDYYLKGPGFTSMADLPIAKEHWLLQVRVESVLNELTDKYLELEYARFMRLYGGTRVPPELLNHFL